MKIVHIRILALASVCVAFASQGQPSAAQSAPAKTMSQILRERQRDVEFQKVPPVKMFDNVWYVGPGYVAVYLIKTSAGAILIDAAEEPDMVQHVISGIQKSGTNLTDIKAIVLSHGHVDHFGGVDRMHELTGAPVYATEEDWQMIEAIAARPNAVRTPRRDRVVKDGDRLTVGDTTLKLYKMPGHTPGVIAFEFTVYDNAVPHKAFYTGGIGGRDGVKGFEAAIASAIRTSQIPGIEVFLPSHAWNEGQDYPNGSLFERFPKLAARKAGEPNPFVDPASWNTFITAGIAFNRNGLEREMAKAAPAR